MKLPNATTTYPSHDINGDPLNGNVPFGGCTASGNGREIPAIQGALIRP